MAADCAGLRQRCQRRRKTIAESACQRVRVQHPDRFNAHSSPQAGRDHTVNLAVDQLGSRPLVAAPDISKRFAMAPRTALHAPRVRAVVPDHLPGRVRQSLATPAHPDHCVLAQMRCMAVAHLQSLQMALEVIRQLAQLQAIAPLRSKFTLVQR